MPAGFLWLFVVLLGSAFSCGLACSLVVHGARRLLERRQRRLEESRRGLCVRCGYDLTGNVSGVCPECGARKCAAEDAV